MVMDYAKTPVVIKILVELIVLLDFIELEKIGVADYTRLLNYLDEIILIKRGMIKGLIAIINERGEGVVNKKVEKLVVSIGRVEH